MRNVLGLITAKRDGGEHSAEDLAWLIGHLPEIPDYQLASWLMAVVCRGMSAEETTALTDQMARSGNMLDLSDVPGPCVDKHSTGGVGDKVSLVLAPLVAAGGATMVKLSGRGLGHTGGTIDKLDSIPGFRSDLEPEVFKEQLRAIRVAIGGQTAQLAPADGRMYALRDVTGTVESAPLICASILSKKIAAGADAILLDVKTGAGAFMSTEDGAAELARLMQQVGRRLGRRVVCAVSEMGQPLGLSVGNAIEVEEALETLKGRGPADLRELCLTLGALLLEAGGVVRDAQTGRLKLTELLDNGMALNRFRDLVFAQGGDPRVVDDYTIMPQATVRKTLASPASGYVSAIDARLVGEAAGALGAGRQTKDDVLDLGAGVLLRKKIGDRVEAGEPLADLLASDHARLPRAEALLESAYSLGPDPTTPPALIKAVFSDQAATGRPA